MYAQRLYYSLIIFKREFTQKLSHERKRKTIYGQHPPKDLIISSVNGGIKPLRTPENITYFFNDYLYSCFNHEGLKPHVGRLFCENDDYDDYYDYSSYSRHSRAISHSRA